MTYTVYTEQTTGGRYYGGQTTRLVRRDREHGTKLGASFLKGRAARIVYAEVCETLAQARSREQQLKKWSRAKKEALIRGDIQQLRELATSAV